MRIGNRIRWLSAAISAVALGALLAYCVLRAPETPRRAGPDPAIPAAAVEQPQAGEQEQSADAKILGGAAWVVVDPESVDELPPYKEMVPGRALVRVSEALRLGTAGGRIMLEIPQLGRTFGGVVERSNTDPYGNVTYIGLLTETNGRDYRFIITAGARNTFAHVSTSRGTFELAASKELGWLMPSANMDQHVDYSRPDYIIREERPPNEH